MKRIPISKVARWPQKIGKYALMYACCFVLCTVLSFGFCYAYFSSKVEATGTITTAQLVIEYKNESGDVSSDLNVYKVDDEGDYLMTDGNTIIPGDQLYVVGSIQNDADSINAYVLLETRLELLTTDLTEVEKVQDSKFYNLNGTNVTFDTTKQYYTTAATLLEAGADAIVLDDGTNLTYTIDPTLTSEMSGRTFKLTLVIHAIQADNLEEDAKYVESDVLYSPLIHATNMLINAVPTPVNGKIYGNSVQQTYTGKNLLDIDGGLNTSLVKNNDGTYTITKTSGSRISAEMKANLLMGVKYTISCEIIETTATDYSLCFYSSEKTPAIYFANLNSNGSGKIEKSFTIADDKYDITKIKVYLSSETAEGTYTIFKNLQIEEGSTATAYEPYVGGVSSPNPNYPQEIVSVGDRTKNLFDINREITSAYNTELIVKGNTVRVTSKASDKTWQYHSMNIDPIEVGTTVTLSVGKIVTSAANKGGVYLYDFGNKKLIGSTGLISTSSPYTATIPEGVSDDIRLLFYTNTNGTVKAGDYAEYTDVQLEIGDTATDYEPYGKYKIEVSRSGKNLFKASDSSIVNPSPAYTSNFTIDTENNGFTASPGTHAPNPDTPTSWKNGFVKLYLPPVLGTFVLSAKYNYDYYTKDGVKQDFGFPNSYTIALYTKTHLGNVNIKYDTANKNVEIIYTLDGELKESYYLEFPLCGYTMTYYNIMVQEYVDNYFDATANPVRCATVVDHSKLDKGFKLTSNTTKGVTSAQSINCYYDLGNYQDFVGKKITISGTYSASVSTNSLINNVQFILHSIDNKDGAINWSSPTNIYYPGSTTRQVAIKMDGSTWTVTTTIQENASAKNLAMRFYISAGDKNAVSGTNSITEGDSFTFDNVKVTTDTPVISYEPYIEPKTYTIFLDEPLRRVGDVADYIDFTTGKVVRWVKEFTLAGTESWSLQSINSYGIANFSTKSIGKLNNELITSNRFLQQSTVIASTESEGLFYANENAFFIRINSSTASDVATFKTWLSNHITKIYGLLTTQTEETIDLPDIMTGVGNTIYTINTTVAPSDYALG